ncbi:DUF4065 domain-containing protein [Pseudomonas argentinensis]|uniref:Panacea domain-containing protein n=1 Tax=Phytopseudomonas argentinensis TaxID=289370 RepID=UPI0009420F74|nr:DUF4065 domain-containing protein [Pseudomonas argentinensis]
MDRLQNIVAYLCNNYPYPGELSKARLTKLVYLADWISALSDNQQLTDIRWIFNHYGPYVEDIISSTRSSPLFRVENSVNDYGASKQLIKYIGSPWDISVTHRDSEIMDFVIKKTKTLYFNDFIDYVYSTYPITSSERYSELNLVELARRYRSSDNS